ncbi:MAG: hypothetical protein ABJB03_00825 [Rhodoglobus sp.]
MTSDTPVTRRSARRARSPQGAGHLLAVGAGIVAFALAAVLALAPPPPPSEAEQLQAYIDAHAQKLIVPQDVASVAIARDAYSATPGVESLVASGTNYDWAKMVLLFGSFPMSDTNVTVLTRWMRQENGPDNWFNRNNPLNNGWGSGGGGGTGTYDSLVIAAQNAADALHSVPGYSGIVDALAASASTEQVEAAIWASPWASGHYDNGGHWSYVPVPVITAPAEDW